jgi:hypothetical protein
VSPMVVETFSTSAGVVRSVAVAIVSRALHTA